MRPRTTLPIPDDIWCVSCSEEQRWGGTTLCKGCSEAEFGDIPWVTGPDGVEQMTEEQAVARSLQIMGVNRAYLRRQARAQRKRGKGFTR